MDNKMIFSSKLYLGDGIKEKKLDKIKKKLEKRPFLAGVYVVAFSQNPADQLELFDAKQLIQKFYESHPCHVVGIASDYDDALKLIAKITQECMDERGDCNLKEYLIC